MENKRGIVIIAIGDEVYSKFTWNLLLSLKYHSPNIPVHLVYEEKTFATRPHILLHADSKEVINYYDTIDENGMFCPARAKLSWYKYNPYKEAIYLDVDALLLKDISPLFDLCKGGGYYCQIKDYNTFEGEDEMPNMLWTYRSTMWRHFGLKQTAKVPSTNSSWQYLETMNEIVLENAIALLFHNRLPISEHRYFWGKGKYQPDELYINASLALIGKDAQLKSCPEPVFFRPSNQHGNDTHIEDIMNEYYAIGVYGQVNNNHNSIYSLYDAILNNISNGKEYYRVYHLMTNKLASKK